ncbi:MAG: hypothetical protein NZ811_07170 [Gammaproteobacteria bacterium]|nr:hypothetical protein [Gammaproteobacteria bacterium]
MTDKTTKGPGKGTAGSPWEGNEVLNNTQLGKDAISHVEELYNIKLNPAQKRIVGVEGFVDGYYKNSDGVLTYGIGQTGEHIQKGFLSAFEAHQDKVENIFGPIGMMSEAVSSELIQLMYRGDVKKSHKWVDMFKKANYKGAAIELLDHAEYKRHKASGKEKGITKRLERASKVISEYNPIYETGEE